MTTIVCIGDSIVEGEGDEMGLGGWAGRLHRELTKNKKVGEMRVYNLGVGMETSKDLLHRFFSEVIYRNPDIVIIQGAHGDSRSMFNNEGEREFEIGKGARMRAYERLFEFLGSSKIKILFLGLNPPCVSCNNSKVDKEYEEHVESHNRGLEILCKKHKVKFLDPRDILKGKDMNSVYVDGIHPNANGYDLMFDAILKELKKLKYI
ncbi:MAG: SGNH/GDSL hydrolase family protein [Candidatus Woesearchaeota archaeon]